MFSDWNEFRSRYVQHFREKYAIGLDTAIPLSAIQENGFEKDAFLNGYSPDWALNWDGTYPENWRGRPVQ